MPPGAVLRWGAVVVALLAHTQPQTKMPLLVQPFEREREREEQRRRNKEEL